MSPDTLYLWLQVVYAIGTLTLFPMAYLVWQIRRNDLRHIDGKLDDLREGLSRIEKKLDEHIQWHMMHRS